jgi:hypothetical protein
MEGRAPSRPHSVRRGMAATTERGPPPTTAKQSIVSAKVNNTDMPWQAGLRTLSLFACAGGVRNARLPKPWRRRVGLGCGGETGKAGSTVPTSCRPSEGQGRGAAFRVACV